MQRDHLRAHKCAMRLVQRQQAAGLVVATGGEVAGQKGSGLIAATARVQVRQQKSDLVGDVDPAEGGFIFDAIEGDQVVVQAHEVARVQITMTFAHAARRMSCRQAVAQSTQLRLEQRAQRMNAGCFIEGGGRLRALRQIHRAPVRARAPACPTRTRCRQSAVARASRRARLRSSRAPAALSCQPQANDQVPARARTDAS